MMLLIQAYEKLAKDVKGLKSKNPKPV